MSTHHTRVCLLAALFLGGGAASTAEDDPAADLMKAVDDLSNELNTLPQDAREGSGMVSAKPALLGVGATSSSAASHDLYEDTERLYSEAEGLRNEVSKLHIQLASTQEREQRWRSAAQEAQQQRQVAAKQLEDKTTKIAQLAKAASDRDSYLQQQLKRAKEEEKEYVALRGARDSAVQEARRWESRAQDAEARAIKTLEAENAAEKKVKQMEFQLSEASGNASATKQQYELAMRISEDSAHRRLAELQQQLQAAEMKVRTADQHARTIDANAHAAIQMAKDKYRQLQVAVAQQEKTMAAEVQESQALAQAKVNEAMKVLHPRSASAPQHEDFLAAH